jgi:glycosyltransferase involved in cell wall biosynthesis
MTARPLRLGVVADFVEEEWPSMDLVTDELVREAQQLPDVEVVRIRPSMLRLASRFGQESRGRRNLDRALGRYLQYPLALAPLVSRFDVLHIADHSYAHLAHLVPPHKLGVYCHDIDAFRALLPPAAPSLPRRGLASLTLAGLRRASVVFHSTLAVKGEIEEHGLVESEKLVHAPYGVAREFSPGEARASERPTLLHVGSLIPRKNPEFLLEFFARLRASFPELRLLQVGGVWEPAHRELIARLGLEEHVFQVRGISRAELAEHYRSARLVVVPSTSEGFGLPVVEALACGAVVMASDIPVLREPGGAAVVYCKVSDLDAWEQRAKALLGDPNAAPPRSARLKQAERFTWQTHVTTILEKYRALEARAPRPR